MASTKAIHHLLYPTGSEASCQRLSQRVPRPEFLDRGLAPKAPGKRSWPYRRLVLAFTLSTEARRAEEHHGKFAR
ncbi:MAG: hypothetical protein ACK53L_18845, partial [Pirellulaceae bacterium]